MKAKLKKKLRVCGIAGGISAAVIIVLVIVLAPGGVVSQVQGSYYPGKPGAQGAPLAPASITCTLAGKPGGMYEIAISWPAVTNATSYNLYRGFSNPTLLAPWTAANRIFTGIMQSYTTDLVTATVNQTVYYIVTAVNAAGESAVNAPAIIIL